jgi:hypothetical protein
LPSLTSVWFFVRLSHSLPAQGQGWSWGVGSSLFFRDYEANMPDFIGELWLITPANSYPY